MHLLLRRTSSYLVFMGFLACFWYLADSALVAFLGDALPVSWFARAPATLALITTVSVVVMLALALSGIAILGTPRREERQFLLSRTTHFEKLEREGQLGYKWLCQEPDTRRNIERLDEM